MCEGYDASRVLLLFDDPNVAEENRVAVVLELDGPRLGTLLPTGCRRGFGNLHMILYHHSIEADGQERIFNFRSASIEPRGLEIDVVGLP